MNIMDIFTSIKPYYRQSQGQAWLLAIVVMSFVLIFTLIYQLYDSLSHILFSGKGQQQVSMVQNATAQSTITKVTQSPLFGSSDQVVSQHVNTKLLLLGVLFTVDRKRAAAIIASQGQEPKLYKINDELADGGRLHSVHADRVVLQRNGHLETLYLDWNKRGSKSLSAKGTSTNNMPENAAASDEDESPSVPAATMNEQSPVQTAQDWQERIKAIREKYQSQFGNQGGANGEQESATPADQPMKGFKGRFGGM